MEQTKIRKRSEVPVEDTWAIEDLYPSDEAWYAELETLKADGEEKAKFAGHLADSAETLYAYLDMMEKVNVKASRLGNYASRRADVDTRNATYQAMSGKFMSTIVELSSASSFAVPEIMAISDEKLDAFYAENPKLERYRRYLTDHRRLKDHILSPAEERLLASAGEMAQAPTAVFGALNNADLT